MTKHYALRLEDEKKSCVYDLESVVEFLHDAEKGERFFISVVEVEETELEILPGK